MASDAGCFQRSSGQLPEQAAGPLAKGHGAAALLLLLCLYSAPKLDRWRVEKIEVCVSRTATTIQSPVCRHTGKIAAAAAAPPDLPLQEVEQPILEDLHRRSTVFTSMSHPASTSALERPPADEARHTGTAGRPGGAAAPSTAASLEVSQTRYAANLADIQAAAERIKGHAHVTPVS